MAKQVAQLKYLRIAPRKVRAVAGLMKGLSAQEAEAQLLHERRRPAKALLKLLRSAMANAKHTKNLSTEKLYVESIRIDQGPMLKRSLPRARGMATPIQKKMSHVMLVLDERENATPPRFTILTPKKTKLPPEERKRKPASTLTERETRERESSAKKERPGFLRRVFSRKSTAGT
ncbi:MAG: 50S ribosomal protein L22 [Candidatus Liptonbacteria bacterium]|nr:50S ribosomal protein L22 [Candidatus Liptonbacteria bacterium]